MPTALSLSTTLPTPAASLAISNPTQDLHHASLEVQSAISHFPLDSWQPLQTTQAFRQAQHWLQDTHPNYAHPYHWAAFTYTGV